MKALILHIGPHKTGTTYLQQQLCEKREDLLGHGLLYPEEFVELFGHHLLFRTLNARCLDEETKQHLARIEAFDGQVMLSSENFSRWLPESIELLRCRAGQAPIKVVYYYRTPSERLISQWQEEVKHGQTASFWEYFTEHAGRPFKSQVLNASVVLDRFATILGAGSIHIVDYAKARKAGSMLSDLLAVAGLHMDVEKTAVVNRMEGLAQVEIIRGLNILARNDRRLHGLNVRSAFWKVRAKCARQIEIIEMVMQQGLSEVELGDCFFDRALRSHVAQKFPRQMGGTGFECRARTHRVPGTDWLFSRAARDALAEIYEMFRYDLWQQS